MLGGRSFQLARIFGIRIGADASWFVALFLLIWLESENYKGFFPGQDSKSFTLAVVSVFLLVLSILLHELGHAVAAIRTGVGVSGIDLWIFGGFTRQRRESPTPSTDFKISAAGPLATLLVAAVAFAVGAPAVGAHAFWSAALPWQPIPPGLAQHHSVALVLSGLCFLNLALLAFNLLPGMPLDGGRILRAAAWAITGDRNRATQIAATGGRVLSYILGAGGLVLLSTNRTGLGFYALFFAFIVGQGARAAQAQTVIHSRIEHLRVADVMDSEPVTIPSETRLDRALDDWFHRYGWDWFPVVDPAGRFLGLVSRADIEKFPEQLRPTSTISQVMQHETGDAYRVQVDAPLETLLGSEALTGLGAIMAVDRDGMLRGVVTVEQVSRALQPFVRTA